MEKAVSVNRSDRCPICGKSDWCRFLPANSGIPGARLINCKRDTSCQDQISSIDGRTYVFIKTCSDQSSLYKDSELHEREKENWKKEHGFSGAKWKPKEMEAKSSATQKESPVDIPVENAYNPLSDEELDRIYRKFLSLIDLTTVHRNYLHEEAWSDILIEKSLARSLPPVDGYYERRRTEKQQLSRKQITKELVAEFGDLKGVPGFYQDDKDGTWTFAGKQGLIFPLPNWKGQIYRIRIRVDHPEIDEKGKARNKYHNFSSYREEKKEDGTIYNYYYNGTQARSQIGFYDIFTKDRYIAYITEGEKKSLVANYVLGHPVICVPGVNSFGKLFEQDEEGLSLIDHVIEQGTRIFLVAYDADKATNDKVLECEKALLERLKDKNLSTGIAEWNIGFGKGIDDILRIGIRPNLRMVNEINNVGI